MRRMIVLRFKSKLYAIESNCPYMRFPFNNAGVTEDEGIICPFHHSAFDIETDDVKEWLPWVGLLAGALMRKRVLATSR